MLLPCFPRVVLECVAVAGWHNDTVSLGARSLGDNSPYTRPINSPYTCPIGPGGLRAVAGAVCSSAAV